MQRRRRDRRRTAPPRATLFCGPGFGDAKGIFFVTKYWGSFTLVTLDTSRRNFIIFSSIFHATLTHLYPRAYMIRLSTSSAGRALNEGPRPSLLVLGRV